MVVRDRQRNGKMKVPTHGTNSAVGRANVLKLNPGPTTAKRVLYPQPWALLSRSRVPTCLPVTRRLCVYQVSCKTSVQRQAQWNPKGRVPSGVHHRILKEWGVAIARQHPQRTLVASLARCPQLGATAPCLITVLLLRAAACPCQLSTKPFKLGFLLVFLQWFLKRAHALKHA